MSLLSSRSLLLWSALFAAVLLVQQGSCRPPDKTDDEADADSDYHNDEGEDYDEGTDEEEEEPAMVGPPPTFITTPLNVSLRPGDDATLPCHVKNMVAGKMVQMWLNGSQTITVGKNSFNDRVERKPDQTLIIRGVGPEDSGPYTCQITSLPVANLTHNLFVHSPAKILRNSGHHVVTIGDKLTLECITSGFPKPTVSWSRQGRGVSGAATSEDGQHLVIAHVTAHSAGVYTCTADNGMATPTHATIQVVVNYKPEVSVEQPFIRSGEREEVELTCVIHGHPRPHIKWLKDGVELNKNDSTRFDFIPSPRNNQFTLRIRQLEKPDFGNYTCAAKNKFGTDAKKIMLSGSPSSPLLIKSDVSDEKIVLLWSVESHAPIAEHELLYRRQGADKWTVVKPVVGDSEGNMYDVRVELPVLPAGKYETIMRSANEFGWSESGSQNFNGSENLEFKEDESDDNNEKLTAETSIGGPGGNGATVYCLSSSLVALLTVFTLKPFFL